MGVRCGGECPLVEDGEDDSDIPGEAVDDAVDGRPSGESFKDEALFRAGTPSGHVHYRVRK
jgi:hypothetical protein